MTKKTDRKHRKQNEYAKILVNAWFDMPHLYTVDHSAWHTNLLCYRTGFWRQLSDHKGRRVSLALAESCSWASHIYTSLLL